MSALGSAGVHPARFPRRPVAHRTEHSTMGGTVSQSWPRPKPSEQRTVETFRFGVSEYNQYIHRRLPYRRMRAPHSGPSLNRPSSKIVCSAQASATAAPGQAAPPNEFLRFPAKRSFQISWRRAMTFCDPAGHRLANRFELVILNEPGVTIYGWGANLVRMPARGPLPQLDAIG
jgi:hypothetical protein